MLLPGGHHPRLEHVATHLVTGANDKVKLRLLRRLLALKPPDERWACLLTDNGSLPRGGVPPADSEPLISMASITNGCICCAASVELRTALVRLLREAQPQRLLIEAPAVAETPAVLGLLSDPWFAPVLDLRAVLLAMEEAEALAELRALNSPEEARLRFGPVGIVLVAAKEHDGPPAAAQELRQLSAQCLPEASFVAGLAAVGLALFSLPGPRLTPRFHPGEPGS